MEKFIPASDVKIQWYSDCANKPEVKILFADGIDTEELPHIYREIPMGDGDAVLVSETQGIVSYGIHSHVDEKRLFWSRGQVTKRVHVDGDVVERKYEGYGASRATFINRLIPDRSKQVFDCGLYSRYSMAGAVSYAYMVHQVKPILAEKGIYLLVVKEKAKGAVCVTSESEQWRIIPSLARDKFVLDGDQPWKEERLAEDYIILHEVGDPDFYDSASESVEWKDVELRPLQRD